MSGGNKSFEGCVYIDQLHRTSNVLICAAIALGLLCASEVLWSYKTSGEKIMSLLCRSCKQMELREDRETNNLFNFSAS